jgi:AcrR family transcriptional regulator
MSTQKRDERWTQLLDAAREVFAKKGYHAATIEDITRVAGVAKGTFYLYFDAKRAVFYELIRGFFERVTEIGRSIAADQPTSAADYYARVAGAAERLAQFFGSQRDLVRLVYRESMGLDERLERMVGDFYRGIAKVEASNVRRGIELGLFRADLDPLVVAYAHIGMVERVLFASLFDREFPHLPDLVDQLISLARYGADRAD